MTQTTMSPPVLYSVADGVAHIEFNRPEVFNAVDVALADGLARSLQQANADESVGAVLLSGRGRAFCAGGDIKAMAASDDLPGFVDELVHASHRAILTLADLTKPSIAVVHGTAAGAGLGYVCAVDLVIAAQSAQFLSAFTTIGLTPDSSTSYYLPQLVGRRRATELTLLNRVLSAQEALSWGLVNDVQADADALGAGRALAHRLTAGHRHALSATRRLVRDAAQRSLADHLLAEASEIIAASSDPAVGQTLKR